MTTTASSDHHGHPVRDASLAHPAPVLASSMAPAPLRTSGSRLGPEEDFPEDLTGLGMADLQVLHSRITRQLDHDYLTDPAGPRCSTMDRRQELQAELNARDTANPPRTITEGTPWTPPTPQTPPTPLMRRPAGSTPSA